jgi:hypothetical protein
MRRFAIPTLFLTALSFAYSSAEAQVGRAKNPAKTRPPASSTQTAGPNANQKSNTNPNAATKAQPNADSRADSNAQADADSDTDVVVTRAGTKLRKVEPKTLKETPASQSGETYLLRYRFEPGLVLRNEVTHLSKNSTRINSVLQDASSRTITDKTWHVLESDEQSTTFEYLVEAVDLSQQFGSNEEIRYNTKEPSEQVPVQFAGAVDTIGKVVSTIRIDARGMVIARSDSNDPPHMGMGDITLPLPVEPVAVGATWEIPRELRIERKDGTSRMIKFREFFKLDKVSAGVATLSVRSEPLSPVNDPTEEAQVMQQLSNGLIQFDVDAGRMISKELAWDHQVVSFSGPGSLLEYSSRLEDRVVSAKLEPRTAANTSNASTSKNNASKNNGTTTAK